MIIPPLTALVKTNDLILFWFRRDLRLEDNHGLCQALRQGTPVLPLFIFDTAILSQLEDATDQRVQFIYEQLEELKKQLEQAGSTLLVCYGEPQEIYEQLINTLPVKALYTNHDYEPYARQRDQAIADHLGARQISFCSFKDQVIFEKEEVVKHDGNPYTVFTPYMKQWKARFEPAMLQEFDSAGLLSNCLQTTPLPLLSMQDLGFQSQDRNFPGKAMDIARIEKYDQQRDIPAVRGTSRLSVHFRFGTISIRKAVYTARLHNEVWLNELIWREFYMMILWHFPHVAARAFKPAYDQIVWRNDHADFQAWCDGKTGYPIVDAGMRELNATGYMHNRLRMITASFLTKHLLIDWRWGEAYFAQKLLDFELSSNNGGWQWVAGSGCDAAPYFRIFNPYLQTKKFDPELQYVKKWIPELQELTYPQPIVNHELARKRTLDTYKQALQ